ncbi:MAG: pyridoxamine 5'-phosphate oxidase [Myxococcaceae bacterium]
MLDDSPVKQFERWFEEASRKKPDFANAMTIATVDLQGVPDARIVLLKEIRDEGLVFFTNYESTKAQQLELSPKAACVFWWPDFERQIRVRGTVAKISAKQSDAYFKTRPRGSQLGAWASKQSQVLQDRTELDTAYLKLEKQFENQEVPRPENWGGYCLKPRQFEFWQGRENRLHDRFEYDLDLSGCWVVKRLAP